MARGNAEVKFSGNTKAYQSAIGRIKSSSKQMQASLSKLIKGIAAIGIAAGVGIGKAVADFAKLEVNLIKTRFLVGGTEADFKALAKQAREMGATTTKTASEAAAAQYEFAKAGLNTRQIMGALPSTLELAEGAQLSIAESAAITASALKIFNADASETARYTDALIASSTTANATVAGLGNQLEYAGGTAAALGYDIETTTGLLAFMANTLGEDKSGRALNQMLLSMQKNSGALKEFGINVYDANGNVRDIVPIMRDFERATAGLTDEQKNNVIATIGDVNAQRALNSVLGQGVTQLDKNINKIKESQGITEKFADVIRDSLQGRWELFQSAMAETGIIIAELLMPAINELLSGVTGLFSAFNNMGKEQRDRVVEAAKLGAKIVGLTAVVAIFAKGIIGISTGLLLLRKRLLYTGLSAKFFWGALSGGLTIIIPLLAAGFVLLYNKSETFRKVIRALGYIAVQSFDAIKKAAVALFNGAKVVFTGYVNIYKRLFGKIFSISKKIIDVFTGMGESVGGVFGSIAGVAKDAFDFIEGIIDGFLKRIEGVKKTISNFLDRFSDSGKRVGGRQSTGEESGGGRGATKSIYSKEEIAESDKSVAEMQVIREKDLANQKAVEAQRIADKNNAIAIAQANQARANTEEADAEKQKIEAMELAQQEHQARQNELYALIKEGENEARQQELAERIARDELQVERDDAEYQRVMRNARKEYEVREKYGKLGLAFYKATQSNQYKAFQESTAQSAELMQSSNSREFNAGKNLALADMAVRTPIAIMKSFEAGGGYPWGLVPAALATVVAKNRYNQLRATKPPQKFFGGSYAVPKTSGANFRDSVPAMLAGGEYVAQQGNDAEAARNNATANAIAARDAGFGDSNNNDGGGGNANVNVSLYLDGEIIYENQEQIRARRGDG